MNILIAVRY